MYENIVYAIGALFAAAGFVSAVYFILLRVIRPEKNEKYCVVLRVSDDTFSPAAKISFALSRIYALGDMGRCIIAVMDCGLRHDSMLSLEEAFAHEKCVIFCDSDNIGEAIANN